MTQEWLRWVLGFLVAAGMSGAVSLITTRTQLGSIDKQLGSIDKRMDTEAAQIREIFRARDKVDDATFSGLRSELAWLKSSFERLERRMDQKFGSVLNDAPVYAWLIADLPEVLPQTKHALIFDNKLAGMRARLDVLIEMLKAGTLDTEEEMDELYSLEIDYEIVKGWQIWCEINEHRRQQCLAHLKDD